MARFTDGPVVKEVLIKLWLNDFATVIGLDKLRERESMLLSIWLCLVLALPPKQCDTP